MDITRGSPLSRADFDYDYHTGPPQHRQPTATTIPYQTRLGQTVHRCAAAMSSVMSSLGCNPPPPPRPAPQNKIISTTSHPSLVEV